MKNQIVELVELVLKSGLEVAQLAEVLNVIVIGKLGKLMINKNIVINKPNCHSIISFFFFKKWWVNDTFGSDDLDIKKLVKILLPRGNVPNFLIIKVLGNLGNKVLKYNVQVFLT